jgi:hypothetical protein
MWAAAMLVGCHGGQGEVDYEANTLELSSVRTDEELPEDVRSDWQGDVTVDGSGGNWNLDVRTASRTIKLDVHSAGHADLSVANGTGMAVSVQPETLSDELSLSIRDANGDPVYLLEPVEPGPLTQELFGLGLIARDEDLLTDNLNGWDLTFTSAVLRTDDGDLTLFPGEPHEVAIDGHTYRAILLESFTADLTEQGNLTCTGASERLAFELVRVEPGTADTTPLVRDATLDIPTSTCQIRTQ